MNSTSGAAGYTGDTGDGVDLAAMAAATGLGGPEVGLVLQAVSGEIVAATAAAQVILGLTLDQMRGRTSQDPRWAAVDEHGEAMTGEQHPAMRALTTGRPVRDVVMGVHRPGLDPAGSHVWLEVSSVPVPTTDRGGPGVVTAVVELHGRRAHDLRLAASERMYRFLAESASDMVAWQLPDTTFLWVSPAATRLLGREPAELVGTRAYDLMPPDDAEAARAAERAAAAGAPAPEQMVLRLRHADGHLVWVEVTGRVIGDADGRPVQLRTAWRDVSARVQAEAERDAALRLVRSAVDSSPIGIALRAVDGALLQANTAMCAMLGRSADELVGSTLLAFTDPDDVPPDDPDGTLALLAGLAVHVSERRYRRGDGTVLWGHRTAVLLRDDRGQPQHVLVQLQDVTERRTAVDELARAALTDPLTGLVNRSAFMERLTHSLDERHRPGSRVGVLFVDLDHFKPVNDTYGHETGDEVLRQAAARISGAVRQGDLVARLGGDEFVALCVGVDVGAALHDIADRVVGALAVPFDVGPHQVRVSASVGLSLAERAGTAREALSRADAAMYRAKQAGRGRYEISDPLPEAPAPGCAPPPSSR